MSSTSVYREVKKWKIPLHISKTQLAKSYIKILARTKVIGITGSVGKTLTQNAISKVLSQKYNVAVGGENLDPTFRIPGTILKTKPWQDFLVLEYGVEHPGDMDHYLNVAVPKIAVFTKISETHTKYFGGKDGVFEEKSKLAKALKNSDTLMLNAGDQDSKRLAQLTRANVVYFGEHAKDTVKISHFSQGIYGSKYRIHYAGQIESVRSRLIGRHQLLSVHAAAKLGIIWGLTLKQIAKGLTQLIPPNHRLNLIVTKKLNIIDDTYNSSPAAAIESIKTLESVGLGRKKAAVFGEMRDLGALSKQAHQSLGASLAKSKINLLITVGKAAGEIAQSSAEKNFRGKIYRLSNTKDAIKILRSEINKKWVVLVKGSRHEHLERVVLGLQHKSTHISCYHCGNLR